MTRHPELTQEALDALEAMIDRYGVAHVLVGMRNILDAKADHLRANWQDEATARTYDRAAVAVGNCAERSAVRDVSR